MQTTAFWAIPFGAETAHIPFEMPGMTTMIHIEGHIGLRHIVYTGWRDQQTKKRTKHKTIVT